MNNIDYNFYNLLKKLKKLTINEIYLNIKNSFLCIPKETQDTIANFFNEFKFWGTIDIINNNFNALKEKAKTLKKNINEFDNLYHSLKDYKSKKLLYAILNNWFCYDFITLKECLDNPYKHYFDLDIIPHCQNEIVVDLGAYIGDTITDYLFTYGEDSYKKIYCYDITKESVAFLKNNLSPYKNIIYRKKAISDKKEELYLIENNSSSSANKTSKKGSIKLKSTTLDSDIKEKITLLKMDIEGDEEKALLGCKKHIQNDNPKLLISVYHSNDHLWKIPKLINSLNNNYNYYLRCYGNCIYPTEIVFFAIPR